MSQYKIRPAFLQRKPASQWQKPFGLRGTNQSDWKEKWLRRAKARTQAEHASTRVAPQAEIFGNYRVGVN